MCGATRVLVLAAQLGGPAVILPRATGPSDGRGEGGGGGGQRDGERREGRRREESDSCAKKGPNAPSRMRALEKGLVKN